MRVGGGMTVDEEVWMTNIFSGGVAELSICGLKLTAHSQEISHIA